MAEKSQLPDTGWSDRGPFLNLAGGLEGGMALAAMGLAWLTGLDLRNLVAWNPVAMAQILAALLPLVVLFGVTYRWPIGPLRRIKEILLDVMGPALAACKWYDLPLLAGLAGIGEELLFRGVLQTGIDRWGGRGVGWITASVIFGLVHAVTPTYAVLATLIGLYLGALLYLQEPPNLVVPIVVHAVYDLIAFYVIRRDYRHREEIA